MILTAILISYARFFDQGGPLLIPFLCFCAGAGIPVWKYCCKADLPGILSGVLTAFVGGFFNIRANRLVGGTGIAGAAASSTAGNAVATPLAIAQADPSLAEVAAAAAPLIAASVIATAILTPVLTSQFAKNRRVRLLWRKTHEIVVIADDFTGSNDTGVQLAKKGRAGYVERVAKPSRRADIVSH